MTDPVRFTVPVSSSRRLSRRSRDAEQAFSPTASDDGESAADDAAPVEPETPRPRRFGFAAFAAQLIGGVQKRGLRGGPETMQRARATYLETEWSGPSDRRGAHRTDNQDRSLGLAWILQARSDDPLARVIHAHPRHLRH